METELSINDRRWCCILTTHAGQFQTLCTGTFPAPGMEYGASGGTLTRCPPPHLEPHRFRVITWGWDGSPVQVAVLPWASPEQVLDSLFCVAWTQPPQPVG